MKRRSRRKSLWTAVLFVAVVTGLQIGVLQHYETILTSSARGGSASASAPVNPDAWAAARPAIQALRAQYPLVAVSDDAQYAACLNGQNQVVVMKLPGKQTVRIVTDAFPVDYIAWVRDDSLLVGEHESGGRVLLKRVDVTSGYQQVIHVFSGLPSSDRIRKITFSIDTNDTYILIGNDYATTVYHFDTNNNLNVVNLGGRYIKNIAVTQSTNCLYFEDAVNGHFNVGRVNSDGSIQVLYRDWALITVVGDTPYIGQLDASGHVVAVYRADADTPQLVQTLTRPVLAQEIHISPGGVLTVLA